MSQFKDSDHKTIFSGGELFLVMMIELFGYDSGRLYENIQSIMRLNYYLNLRVGLMDFNILMIDFGRTGFNIGWI